MERHLLNGRGMTTSHALSAPHFSSLVQPVLPRLLAHARRLTREASAADDLVQDTLTRAWRYRHRFALGTNIGAWLHRILFNSFISGYRKKKRERRLLEKATQEFTIEARRDEPRLLDKGLSDEPLRALAHLPEQFRDAVVAVDLEGMSYREAAARFDCPLGTMMSRLHRGRRLLRVSLDEFAYREGYVKRAA